MNAAAMKTPEPRMVTVESDVLGEMTVPETRMIHFPEGLLGFPDSRDYVLVPAAHDGAYWLQSAEHASLIFFLVDPFLHYGDYEVELTAAQVDSIGAQSQSDIAILAIVTLPSSDDAPATANLQGPLAINVSDGVARQVILRDAGLGVRRPLRLED